jgi:hypothetical protein
MVASSLYAEQAEAQATTGSFDYYVAVNGNDNNPGTLASPWAITSLQNTSKNNALIAGKRLGLLPGTYDIHTLASGSSPGNYTYPVLDIPSGTGASPTVVASSNAAGNYTPRTATIYNVGGQITNAPIGQNGTRTGNFVLDGIVLDISNQSCSGIVCNYGGNPGTGPGAISGITIRNCEIYGLNGKSSGNNYALIALQNAYAPTITNNCLHDFSGWDNLHIHAYLEFACTNSSITYNTIYNGPAGTLMKSGCAGQVIAYNYFYNLSNCAVHGLDGATGSPNTPNTAYTIHHNVIDNCNRVSVGDLNSSRYQDIVFYNNTIYNSQASGISGLNLVMAGGAKCSFYNNICHSPFATSGWSGGAWGANSGSISTWDYNCYFSAAYTNFWSIYNSTVYSNLAAWQSATGAPDAHSIATSPVFVSGILSGKGASQFKLGSSSPCLSKGVGGTTMGAWDGTVAQIGCNFDLAATAPKAPGLMQIA